MPTIDDYLLKRSSPVILGNTQEGRTDLTLTQSSVQTGTIHGTVTNTVTGAPVGGAVVKLRMQSGDPVMHTLTNPAGHYTLTEVTPNTYTINVAMQGYLTSSGQTFTISQNQSITVNAALTPESVTNTIYGVITNLATGDPINGVYVVLIQNPSAAQNAIQALSNADGEYIITKVPDGTRSLVANFPGYYTSTFIPTEISGGSIVNTDISLQAYQLPQATVNGYIKNQSGNPLVNACVGLYQIDAQGIEILKQITYSDSMGFYIFGRMAAGTYVVKSKTEKTVSSIA